MLMGYRVMHVYPNYVADIKRREALDKITAIDGGGTKDKIAEDLRKLTAALPGIIEHVTMVAQITRAKYLALVAQGFTDAQAVELCKTL